MSEARLRDGDGDPEPRTPHPARGDGIEAAERDCNLRMAMVLLDPETPAEVLRHMRVELTGIGKQWLREHESRHQSSFEDSFARFRRAIVRRSDLAAMRKAGS